MQNEINNKIFNRAESFKEYLEDLKTYQYVTYYLTIEDCKDPFVRENAGKHRHMLDFLVKHYGMPFICPDGNINTLEGITITESDWLWRLTTPKGFNYYYPEHEVLVETEYKKFDQKEIVLNKEVDILCKNDRFVPYLGKFVKKDGEIFFKNYYGLCISLNEIGFYYYTNTK